jgi:sterol desaturase/sphingolipid hydroxylase (fatty acid hydroxylase superfamily)
MRAVLKIIYAPAMLLGFNGVALWIIGSGAQHAWLMPLLLGAIGISFLVERLIPYDATWNHDRGDTVRDVMHALINEVSVYLSAALIPLLTMLSPATGLWPSDWPLWAQLLMAVLVADFGITLCHWASHRNAWLWRLHAVHHSVKRMYGFNGLMKHPLHQALETTVGTMPLVLAGMPLEVGLLLGFAVAIQLLLQHSNTDMRIGPLRHFLALAPVHRFHHLKWGGIGDVNFGLFTCLWDHLLGTAAYEPDRRFTSDDFGIGKQPDYPVDYLAQLAAPFRSEVGAEPVRPTE